MSITVISTQKHTLRPIELPYPMQFAWNLKKGISKDKGIWFTSRKLIGKVWVGVFEEKLVGEISIGTHAQLMTIMFSSRVELFTDGRDYFTTTNEGNKKVLLQIVNWPEVKQKLDKEFAFVTR